MKALMTTADCTSSQLSRGLGMPRLMSRKTNTGASSPLDTWNTYASPVARQHASAVFNACLICPWRRIVSYRVSLTGADGDLNGDNRRRRRPTSALRQYTSAPVCLYAHRTPLAIARL